VDYGSERVSLTEFIVANGSEDQAHSVDRYVESDRFVGDEQEIKGEPYIEKEGQTVADAAGQEVFF
jgi:hypothetical protein